MRAVVKSSTKRHYPPDFKEREGVPPKETCFIAFSAVERRVNSTVDLLSVGIDAKALWEQHLRCASTISMPCSGKKDDDSSLLGEFLLFNLDALVPTFSCLRWHMLLPTGVEGMKQQLMW
ncbi:hypothetical protein GH5_04193 [Leishmania sp. Ghana 2012 LV757]|uniref:hypothetical protein n=1 Tax=Leishmania sp. Ghana 2012 LV757 TaxID=2803181 RepID=UPI001B6CF4B8|nr:hypothetical protein GH5_04193 [Leishmania sp. Ghana 2012 LV757]